MSHGTSNTGICKLCEKKGLLRRSHILSEFLYEHTYQHFDPNDPKKKRLLELPADPDEKLEYPQKGFRERLLCSDCEQHLNRIGERYAADVLKRMDALTIPPEKSSAMLPGVEYAPFKLFMMTQLWRMGVASGDRWSKVRLGPQEKKLRDMLLNEDPGTPTQYACYVTKVPASLGPISRVIDFPSGARYGGHHWYEFIARGHSWTFVASDKFKGYNDPDLRLSEHGELPILSDVTGSLDLRAKRLIHWAQEQRTIRES